MRVGFEVTGTEFGLAWRRLRKRWTITVLAVVTLALAMGASTVMFSVSYGLVQHPLPFPRAQRLVWLQSDTASTGRIDPAGLSVPDVLDYRVRTHALEHVAAFEVSSSTMVGRGQPEHVRFAEVSGDFFPALAVPPLLGRSLTRQDEIPSFPRTAVLSYGLWLQKYAANPAVIGRSIDLDHRLLTVVGVMPAGFRYPSRVRIWLPEPMASSPLPYRYWRHVSAIARLRPGVTLVAAQKDMTAIASALAREYPKDDSDVGIKLTSMADHVAGPLAPSVDLMMAGVLLVLALACANVGNLLLGAAITRWPEIALQVSLGARRRRLFGQLLAEGLLLAGLAGAGGWLLAWGAMPLVRHLQGTALPQMADIGLDPAVVAFAVGLTVMMALWFALAPAIELLHPHAGRQLVHSAGNTRRRSRLPGVLVVVEVAITVVLLLGAGLFWQTLRRQRSSNPGFRPASVLTFKMTMLANSYKELNLDLPYYMQLNQRLQQLPGVVAAGMVNMLPLSTAHVFAFFAAAGTAATARPEEQLPGAELCSTLPGYFRAMGIPLRGRGLQPSDNLPKSPLVVVISAHVAREVFGSQNPLGRSLVIKRARHERTARVVGVAGGVARRLPGGPLQPAVYLPLNRLQVPLMNAVILTRGNPEQLLPQIRRVSAQLNPDVALWDVATMQQRLDRVMLPITYRTNLLAALALLALCLAAAGLYGVLAHSVAQQRHDIGIRMALGASAQRVGGAVLIESLRLIVAGVAVGLLVFWWLQGSLRQSLHIGAPGALTWVAVPVLVLLVGAAATLVPARRAASVDPALTLRRD